MPFHITIPQARKLGSSVEAIASTEALTPQLGNGRLRCHDRVPYRDLGPDWAARRFSPAQRAKRLTAQLEALGYDVTVQRASSPPEL
ncbi:hypothetical protein ACSHXN_45470 (plasmid) [Streptomyces sp. HUAS TT11]|uniref:hypothetical protein n=1 Tax=Streptomyces sp. HUAS TT11 TaxID=3447508 RepID=UPI003F65BCC4